MCVCLVSNSVYVGGTCQRWRWMKEPRFPSTTLDWIQMISVIHLTCQWFKVVADQWISGWSYQKHLAVIYCQANRNIDHCV